MCYIEMENVIFVGRNFLQPSHTFEKEVQMYSLVFLDMARWMVESRPLEVHRVSRETSKI